MIPMTQQQPRQVQVISEDDLGTWKRHGRRIRACCPVHGSRDRDLSINPWFEDMDEEEEQMAGWGYCHSIHCHATVLVKEWNPRAAWFYTDERLDRRPPRIQATTDQMRQAEEWQIKELAALRKIASAANQKLTSHPRALSYLAGRGITDDVLDLAARLGVGYLPAGNEWRQEPPYELRKWVDRILFPFTTPDGETGYIGRSLFLWQEGMDEHEHKRIMDTHNAQFDLSKDDERVKRVLRWQKTYRSGFFHAEAFSLPEAHHVLIVEGTFDALSLLAAGLSNVVAVAGTHIEVEAIPSLIWQVTIAFDGDAAGQVATIKLQKQLMRKGIETQICCAPSEDGRGKDWSERYRLHGRDGLAALLSPPDQEEHMQMEEEQGLCCCCADEGRETPASHEDAERLMYCDAHWQPAPPVVEDEDMRMQMERIGEHLVSVVWPDGTFAVEVFNCTPAEYIARRKMELDEEVRRRGQTTVIEQQPQRLKKPSWLIYDTYDYWHFLERVGPDEMKERQEAWKVWAAAQQQECEQKRERILLP